MLPRRASAQVREGYHDAMGPLAEKAKKNGEGVVRQEGLTDSAPNAIATAVRQDLSKTLQRRDEMMRGLQGKLVAEVALGVMPFEQAAAGGHGNGGANGGGGASNASNGDAARAAEVKEAQRLLSEAAAEKEDLAGRIKAAQQQLEAALANRPEGGGAGAAGGADGGGAAAAAAGGGSEGGRGPPPFGRRAPPMPTRQGTMDPGAAGASSGPSPMVQNKLHLQTDNLGQVSPLAGSFSPGDSPAPAHLRQGSASGRRRSRLAERADGEMGEANGEGGAEGAS